MKDLFVLISVSFMLLLGIGAVNAFPSVDEGKDVSYEPVMEHVLPSVHQASPDNTFCLEAQSLARQLRLGGRGQRTLSLSCFLFSKVIPGKTLVVLSNALEHSFHRYVSSLPCPSWEVASEHYVFGMRRILI